MVKDKLKKEIIVEEMGGRECKEKEKERILEKVLCYGGKGRPKKHQMAVFEHLWVSEKDSRTNIINLLKSKKLVKKKGREGEEKFEKRCEDSLRHCRDDINEALGKLVFKYKYIKGGGIVERYYAYKIEVEGGNYKLVREKINNLNEWVKKKREREKGLARKSVKVKAPRKGLIPVITSESLLKVEEFKSPRVGGKKQEPAEEKKT